MAAEKEAKKKLFPSFRFNNEEAEDFLNLRRFQAGQTRPSSASPEKERSRNEEEDDFRSNKFPADSNNDEEDRARNLNRLRTVTTVTTTTTSVKRRSTSRKRSKGRNRVCYSDIYDFVDDSGNNTDKKEDKDKEEMGKKTSDNQVNRSQSVNGILKSTTTTNGNGNCLTGRKTSLQPQIAAGGEGEKDKNESFEGRQEKKSSSSSSSILSDAIKKLSFADSAPKVKAAACDCDSPSSSTKKEKMTNGSQNGETITTVEANNNYNNDTKKTAESDNKSIQVEIIHDQSLKNLDTELTKSSTEASTETWPLPMLVFHHQNRQRRPQQQQQQHLERRPSTRRRQRSRSSSRGRRRKETLWSWNISIEARASRTQMENDRNIYMEGISRLSTYKDEFGADCTVYEG